MSPRADVATLLGARRERQRQLIDLARWYVATLNSRLPVVAAMVVGSVARGDFNLWSDIDLVVVIDRDLPARAVDRLALADEGRPPGIQAVLWTPGEFAEALGRNNPMAVEAITAGVVV